LFLTVAIMQRTRILGNRSAVLLSLPLIKQRDCNNRLIESLFFRKFMIIKAVREIERIALIVVLHSVANEESDGKLISPKSRRDESSKQSACSKLMHDT